MELRVNDYVRTDTGQIGKITLFEGDLVRVDTDKFITYKSNHNEIIKSSPNIIDLIEVGDYVNGVLVESIYRREKEKLYIHSFDTEIMMCFTKNNIKSIVTKEMYSSVEYKVGE